MVIGAIIECSTCNHKVRLRYQVGYVRPVTVKIACNGCGKLLKGEIYSGKGDFVFPNETVHRKFEITTQTVSISGELPIAVDHANRNELKQSTPYLALTRTIGSEKVATYQTLVTQFISDYDQHFDSLVTCYELFENRNWPYFLTQIKKTFDPGLQPVTPNFKNAAVLLAALNKHILHNISTDYYDTEFSHRLHQEILAPAIEKTEELGQLNASLQQYINIETEFIRGVKLIERFLKNIKSFLPVIVLAYQDDFTREYKDEFALTTFEFSDLKDIYIEQFEYLCRISALYFGLENLGSRNSFDDFGQISDCARLSDYYRKDNGIKKDIIKKSPLLAPYFLETLNSQIRNGIGHLKTTYQAKEQLIVYFPYKDPNRINQSKEIYLVDFAFQVYQQALKVKDSLEVLSVFIAMTHDE